MKSPINLLESSRAFPAALFRGVNKLPVLVGSLLLVASFTTGHAQTDLALNKPIAADSVEAVGREANKANDGSASTRWSSNFSGGTHWIYVDLTAPQSITRVKLNWESAYGRNYVIQSSNDATTWTTLVTVTNNAAAGVKDYTGLSANGRYVRVYCTLPSVWGNISLFDLNVYGSGTGAPLPNGTYTLAPLNSSGLRLDVAGSGTGNGTNVDATTPTGGANQQWILTNVSGSVYRLSPAHATAQCLDVSGQATASGTNVQTWQYLGQLNQQWALTAVSGGYTLTPQHATALRLNNTGTGNGSNVNVTTASGSSAQTWNIVAVSGGSVPAAPTGLSASAGNTQITLAWTASAGATSYSVFRGTTSNGQSTTAIATNLTGTSYTNTGLTNGTTYYYKVKAVNSSGSSGYSNEASATPTSGAAETVGGGTISSPAVGPAAAYGRGTGYTLVKNWNFGTGGTIKNYADMNAHFMYHDHWNTINNGGNYGASMASPDNANALPGTGQPIEGVNCPTTRTWSADALRTLLVPINNATNVDPMLHNVACGSFTAKWSLPNGGSRLNQDLIWETRVRYVTPRYFWFAIWTAGVQWNNGAEMDVMESNGWDNGGGSTNYDGRYWHVNSVGGNDTLFPNFLWDWPGNMAAAGVPANWDPAQYHIWQWVYKKDNTYEVWMDNIKVQAGNIHWTDGATSGGTPIDMFFLFDAGWGHTVQGNVNHSMPASELTGKFYEWDYSRVYLRP